ncbi:MAG: hypothetical protein EXX96DRAFT_474547 [Benjaminiella poitrasii]|nr:MAG: hypothetical protein EXX96DRAFT_474547 [Benjaminiella poitrasii]
MTVDTVPSFVSDDSDFDDIFIDDDNDSIDSEIPDENIDFDLVYALRTFVATTDGQTSVVKGDALVLLDDSNSYWWLVKASSETGYIPAENIEMPFERLARLNKHRNTAAEVDSTIIPEIATPAAEASHSPQPSSRSPVRQTKRVKMSSQVQCQVQIVLESIHDDEYEELYEDWDEELINDIDDEPIDYSPVLNPTFPDASPLHHLRIFSGNIQGRIEFSVVAVTPEMNTEQVIQLALQKFHIQDDQPGVEYFMTVKSMDSDEITLMPQDKPLGIFESLTDHLTTPMPSLKHIKRLSLEQPSIKVTRVGVSKARQRAKAHFGEASDIQFALHQRIKRTTTGREGQIYVKMIYYAVRQQQSSDDTTSHTNGLVRKSSLLHNADRMEKLVSVRMKETMRELVPIALDKFHLARENPSEYCICLPVNGKGN